MASLAFELGPRIQADEIHACTNLVKLGVVEVVRQRKALIRLLRVAGHIAFVQVKGLREYKLRRSAEGRLKQKGDQGTKVCSKGRS